MPARHSQRANSKRSRRLRGQAGVGLLVGGVTLAVAAAAVHGMALKPARPTAVGPAFESHTFQPVVQALRRYAGKTTDGRSFPAPDDWIDDLAARGLLPGNLLPASPWKAKASWFGLIGPVAHRQSNTLEWPSSLVGARQLVRGARATAPGISLGAGHAPLRDTFDVTTFGALIYDADPTGQVAVLYGIGKQGDQAVVSAVQTLGQSSAQAMRILRQPLKLVRQSSKVTERSPSHDLVTWHLTIQNLASYEVSAFLTVFFQGASPDDNLKVSGARFDVPAHKTLVFDGQEKLAPGEGDRLKHIRLEQDGHSL